MVPITYNVRLIGDMRSGLTAEIHKLQGFTHYLCRWNSDGTRNAVIRPYKSYAAAERAAVRLETKLGEGA